MTPRLRTLTSGLRIILNCGVSKSWNSRKLKRRTLYGQLLEQYRVPTQRLYTMSFRPSVLCTVAPTGQTTSQGAFLPVWEGARLEETRRILGPPFVVHTHSHPLHLPAAHRLPLADDG